MENPKSSQPPPPQTTPDPTTAIPLRGRRISVSPVEYSELDTVAEPAVTPSQTAG
jgi:hypothetical protein